MIFTPVEIEGVWLVDIEPRCDERGFFARSWCGEEFARRGLADEVRQTNIACTRRRGTLRGLHYQAAPYEEAKLVRCTRGAAFVAALRPDVPAALLRRGQAAEVAGAGEMAAADFETVLEKFPDSEEAEAAELGLHRLRSGPQAN